MKKAFLIVAVIAGTAWLTGNVYAQPREKQGQEKKEQGDAKGKPNFRGEGKQQEGKGGERQGGFGQGNFQQDPAKMLEAIFARIDKNGDGKLTGDEIPAPMKERLEMIDTNKDSSVDKTEMLAAMKARMQRQREGQGKDGKGNFKPGDGKGNFKPGDGKGRPGAEGRFNQGGENGKGPQRPKRPAAE
jgi:hypothetical protein